MYDMTNVPIDVLLDEIDRRKQAQLTQEHSDQAILRTIIVEALSCKAHRSTVLRAMQRSCKPSDISLFLEGCAHKFNVCIQLIYCKDNQ